MFAAKVPIKGIQKAKQLLIEKGLLDTNYLLEKGKKFAYLPLQNKAKIPFDIVERPLNKKTVELSLRNRLALIVKPEQLERLKTSMDSVGTIGIIELDHEFHDKSKQIAEEFLKNKNMKTIMRKRGSHEGEFRLQSYEYLAGENTSETVHVENGCRILLDVNTVYFSMRLATERKRIAGQVKKGERILVMFSGCAPYPCVLSKNTEAKDIVGVEINPEGHAYGLKNLKLNKIKNVKLICGDVRKEVPKLKEKFDRILMPLPRTAEDFLEAALSVSKKGTIIHFYNFQAEGEFKKADEKVKASCEKAGFKCKILKTVKSGQNAPRFFRICVDFRVE